MAPRVIVLYGGYAFERVRNLINAMCNRPNDLDEFGRVMVDLMCAPDSITHSQIADRIQHYVRQFNMPDSDDPGFDERIMYEALTFGAKMFRAAWIEQVQSLHGIPFEGYQFRQWLGQDLALERRDSL